MVVGGVGSEPGVHCARAYVGVGGVCVSSNLVLRLYPLRSLIVVVGGGSDNNVLKAGSAAEDMAEGYCGL